MIINKIVVFCLLCSLPFVFYGCGGTDCYDFADEICDCENIDEQICKSSKAYAKTAEEDESGMRNEECARLLEKFNCNIPDYLESD